MVLKMIQLMWSLPMIMMFVNAQTQTDEASPPVKLILNLNVYLDSSWFTEFGQRYAVKEAREILKLVQDLFKHESLDTKIDIEFGDRIYNSSAPHLILSRKAYEEFNDYLQEPFQMEEKYAVVHLLLTTGGGLASEISKIGSLCDENPKSMVKFNKNTLRTAESVAHGLSHLLGMQHDFMAVEGRREKCQENRRAGGTIMNYGEGRTAWSSCSNADFKDLYSKVINEKDEFCLKDPQTQTGEASPPVKLILNLNVYLDRSWFTEFGKRYAVKEAREILKHVQDLFKHESLDTKIDIEFGDRIYNSSAPHLLPNRKSFEEFNYYLQAPFQIEEKYAVVHLLLTTATGGRSRELSRIESLCNENPKSIVKFHKNTLRTAETVAHGLGHVLGMHHDSIPVEGRREKCQESRSGGGTIMNYGEGRTAWTSCSNADFKHLYSKVINEKGEFCLKDPAQGVKGRKLSSIMEVLTAVTE